MPEHTVLVAQALTGPRGTHRVTDIDLRLEKGELLHVHGASGSGKTTLLRLLSRLDPLETGELRLGEKDATEIPVTKWRRRVCLVFQESRVFPTTIEENLLWGARQHGIEVDVKNLMTRVGLELRMDTPAVRLSGGEAKRLAIARALAVEPDVLLLDEPTGPLDEVNRERLRGLIRDLQHEEDLGVILVSHLDEDLLRLPGAALHLAGGRIRHRGPSRDLYEKLRGEQRE